MVWVTGTNSNGVTLTTESTYYQTFASFYSVLASPSSGSIGLGTISGSVGEIRTYSIATVTATNNANNLKIPGDNQTGVLAKLWVAVVASLGVMLM